MTANPQSPIPNTQQFLNYQADRIEQYLNTHGHPVHVLGGVLAPRWIQYSLAPGPSTRLANIRALADDLAIALGASACRIAPAGARINLEINRPDPRPVYLLPLQRKLRNAPAYSPILGLEASGRPLLLQFTAPQVAHALISGTTGCGKTALACSIVASLVLVHSPADLALILIDPKRRKLAPLAGLPHLARPLVTDPGEAADLLHQLVALMLQRDADAISTPRVIIVIDELADILIAAPDARQPLVRLAQRGREAGLHLLCCTQKPTSAAIDSLATANFPVRLVGQVTSAEEAKIATGYPKTGAERLRGPGDFLAVNGGQLTRFQAAYITTAQLAQLTAQLAARHPTTIPNPLALAQSTTSHPGDPTSPPLGGTEGGDPLDHQVALIRDIWATLLQDDGSLKYRAKADIAEVLFGKRTTAGSYGIAVNAVIERLRAEQQHPIHTYAQAASVQITRQTITMPPKLASKTTTTTNSRPQLPPRAQIALSTPVVVVFQRAFRHLHARLSRRVRIVLMISTPPRALLLPNPLGQARLILIQKQSTRYTRRVIR